jgi:hypothetical protein
MSKMIRKISRRFRRKNVAAQERPPARGARIWSNEEISLIASHVRGDVVNVSAWQDEDKQGRQYRDYFTEATSYHITNYDGWRGRGLKADYTLDLQMPAPRELVGRYDLVFNHTTLEHIFDIHQAFRTMASISRDAMLIIVPFMQHLHGPKDGDFWRPSPYAMRRLHSDAGLEILRESAGPKGGKVRYLSYFSTKQPQNWKGLGIGAKGDCELILREAL